jgi:membrane-bound lytic murein transglycosylase D
MLRQRRFLLVLAVIVLGVAVGYAIAEGFGESPPAPAVSAVTAATVAPTSPPTATAAPTSPPTATAAPATASPEVAFTEYTVQPGDTLFTIARVFGLTPEEILAVNTIANPDSLDVGQVIRIPRA